MFWKELIEECSNGIKRVFGMKIVKEINNIPMFPLWRMMAAGAGGMKPSSADMASGFM